MGRTAFGKVLPAVQHVIAAINRPIVASAHHIAAARAVARVGRQETAFAGRFLQRFVERRGVKQGDAPQSKGRMVGDGVVARYHLELGAAQFPPGTGHFAVRNKPAVENELFLDPLGPFAFEIEGVAGGQDARPRLDLGRRSSAHLVKLARLVIDVVIGAVAFHLVAVEEMLEFHVAAGVQFGGIGVVVDFIGLQLHFIGFHFYVAAETAPRAFRLLFVCRFDVEILGSGSVRPGQANLLVGIGRVHGRNLRG